MAYDANKHLVSFHDDRVFVTEAELDTYRNRSEANRDRLPDGHPNSPTYGHLKFPHPERGVMAG